MYDRVFIYEFEGNLSPQLSPAKPDEDCIGFWKEAGYSFLFFRKEKKELLKELFPPYRSETVIRHEDWESGQTLGLFQVGHFTVYPPWNPPPSKERVQICIDPGMAFGSGCHASTKGCLILLDKLFE